MSVDPKRDAGDKKDPLHLLPTVALRALARVLKLGADKYGVYNWRESEGVRAQTYSAAIMRHLTQFMDGEDADGESGESHLAHIMASCAILLDAEKAGRLIDDRVVDPLVPTTWRPPCDHFNAMRCRNADSPVRCGGCVNTASGWTNFVEVSR